ncbi:MAG: HD domain-containing protein [Deltaproteobacteria bacterium]|nr:HD domain-containing protein [Deltaproteobacteria bacterium]
MSDYNRFLSKKDEPILRIRCPVHGFIRFSENEEKFINHPLFQRLRNIKQLALACYVYPGALHSRFEHSLGVMQLVTQAFDSLYRNYGDILKESFASVYEFKKNTIPKVRQLVRLVALLHDIGHTPFSHAGEILAPDATHENISIYAIKNRLKELLNKTYWNGIEEWIVKFIDDSQQELPPQFSILKQLISSHMDFDRTDYLIRDSFYCGVDYGRFDYKRLLESLAIKQENDRIDIAIDRGGWHVFEALILARYQMNTQVYYHRIRRIYDYYIREYLKIIKEKFNDIDWILDNDDVTILNRMRTDANKKSNNKLQKYADRIINRKHHKVILEVGDHADANDLKRVKNVFNNIKSQYEDIDFVLDDGSGSIHKLFIAGEQKIDDDLFIVEKNSDIYERLTEKSKIISKIPKGFRVLRIFADTDRNKIKKLKEESQKFLDKA